MTAGGKREGAGRPKVEKPLVTKCFRVDEDLYNKAQEIHGKAFNKKVNAYIKRLSQMPARAIEAQAKNNTK
jgi:hypothetical protein